MKAKDKADLARKVIKGVRAIRGLVSLAGDVAEWVDQYVLGEEPNEKEPKP